MHANRESLFARVQGRPSLAAEVARRLQARSERQLFVILDADGEVREASDCGPVEPGTVRFVVIIAPGLDEADFERRGRVEGALRRFRERGGVVRRPGEAASAA